MDRELEALKQSGAQHPRCSLSVRQQIRMFRRQRYIMTKIVEKDVRGNLGQVAGILPRFLCCRAGGAVVQAPGE